MQRVGFQFKIKKERIDEYKKHHAAVWPEMLAALRRNGWRNYSIFLRPDGLLFGYYEAVESPEAAEAGMAKEAINLKWQEFMAPFFDSIEGRPDENMMKLEEVFHTD